MLTRNLRIVLCLLSLFAAFGWPATAIATDKQYEDSENHFKLVAPEGWTPLSAKQVGAVLALKIEAAPSKDASPSLAEVQVHPGGAPIDNIAAEMGKSFKSRDPNAVVDAPEKTTLGGQPAVALKSTVKLAGRQVRALHIICAHGGKDFVFAYLSSPDRFDTWRPEIQKLIDSFQFTQ